MTLFTVKTCESVVLLKVTYLHEYSYCICNVYISMYSQSFEVILLRVIIVMLTRLLLDVYLGAIICVTTEIRNVEFQSDCK